MRRGLVFCHVFKSNGIPQNVAVGVAQLLGGANLLTCLLVQFHIGDAAFLVDDRLSCAVSLLGIILLACLGLAVFLTWLVVLI